MAEAIYIGCPWEPSKKIEFFVEQPKRNAPWPVILYVHGHQHPKRPGGRSIMESGYLDQLAASGTIGMAISQPGYGASDGPPDYCGPHTQAAITAVLQHAAKNLNAALGQIAVIGASRGAVASAMMATKTVLVNALVLSAGFYDFEGYFRNCPWSGIKHNIEIEAGTTKKAFDERSALQRVDKISCPVLILHGGQDDQISLDQAEQFAAALALHVPVALKVFPDEPHAISRTLMVKEAHAFINKRLGLSLPLSL